MNGDRDQLYAIGVGSNRCVGGIGGPTRVIEAAVETIGKFAEILASSSIHLTPALGPAGRDFANAALLIETSLAPPELLAHLKQLEHSFGRRRGRRWGARSLDLDILLWSGGRFDAPGLSIPHRELARRAFVLDPLCEIAPDWRLPGGPFRVHHLRARLTRRGVLG